MASIAQKPFICVCCHHVSSRSTSTTLVRCTTLVRVVSEIGTNIVRGLAMVCGIVSSEWCRKPIVSMLARLVAHLLLSVEVVSRTTTLCSSRSTSTYAVSRTSTIRSTTSTLTLSVVVVSTTLLWQHPASARDAAMNANSLITVVL